MSDSIFGFTGKGFVALVADSTSARSILAYKHDEDKIKLLDSHKMVAVAGPQADCTAFIEYIQKNIALTEFKTNLKLSTAAATSYLRKELAKALRKNPYQVNMLIGGWDKETSEGSLYFMDYLASAAKSDYGAQGYAGYFLLSTMDRFYKKDMSVEEAVSLAKICIAELRTRFLLNQQNFRMKIADKDGVREIEL